MIRRGFTRAAILCAAVPCLLTAAPARAASSFAGIDALTSTVLQEGQSSFSGIALRARVTTVRLIEGWELLPTFEYWRNGNTVEPFDIRTSRRDATLGCDIRYNFRREHWTPYVGGGLGVHFLSSEVNAPSLGLYSAENSVMKGGVSLLGGVTFPLSSRVDNFVEAKYHHVSDYRQLKLNWGLSFRL